MYSFKTKWINATAGPYTKITLGTLPKPTDFKRFLVSSVMVSELEVKFCEEIRIN